MGTDAEAVVTPDLVVRGVAGLRVADASIMPAAVSGTTTTTCLMIGEKAADLLSG
jgi:choline dehydrogenase